jgi:cyclopropane-fatty-acyl-phospholipid synthase
MTNRADVVSTLEPLVERLLHRPLPVRLRGWDGSETGPAGPDVPVVVLKDRTALRYLAQSPNELGLGRAYVSGALDVEGDLYAALDGFSALVGSPRQDGGSDVTRVSKREILRAARSLGVIGRAPEPPPEEVRQLRGRRHSRGRDKAAISHHYDVGNDFYRRVLGPSMVYSCAYFRHGSTTLEQAQHDKLELVARKLDLRPGMRLLDVGCGWGSMALHAALEHGVEVVGVTISEEQATLARKRVADAGLDGRVDIRVQDYRDVDDGPFDAISSIGMAEHVGAERFREYAAHLHELLRPGGRLLNHQIARRPGPPGEGSLFIQAYVFPDGELSPIGDTVAALELAGFEVRDVESLREHYARTLRAWVQNLDAGWDDAVAETSEGRARVWRIYMAGSAIAFETNRIGVNQVLAVRPGPNGRSGMPATRDALLRR